MRLPGLMAIGLAIVAVISGGWYYFSSVKNAPEAPKEDNTSFAVPLEETAPQPMMLSLTPEGGWSLGGLVKRIDLNKKFIEMKMTPVYAASLESQGFDDTVRFYFDDSLGFPHIKVQTENGVMVRMIRAFDFPLEDLKPGKPIRAFGHIRTDGTYFAHTVFIFDFEEAK